MTHLPIDAPQSTPMSSGVVVRRPPGVVVAAVAMTWAVASAAGAVTTWLSLALLATLAPVLGVFDEFGNLAWYATGSLMLVVSLTLAANLVATYAYLGRGWARWALISMAALAGVGGLLAFQFVFPLAGSLAAVAVVGLLLLPDAARWFSAASPSH